ncbi:MAG: extracellular solute-binding protein [Limnochordaceae bacterium]|nr:extracellular solute-binding protein [Limnochordaceae bacterium]
MSKPAMAAVLAALILVAGLHRPARASPATGEPITMWVPARGGYLPLWRHVAELARRAHPHLQLALEPIWDDYTARLTLALAERRAPPLVVVDAMTAARLAARGFLADVTDRVVPYGGHPAALTPFELDGRVWAVPAFLDPVLLYANEDQLRQAGVLPPQTGWSWQDLTEAARRVQASGTARWGMGVNGWPPMVMFVWQAGGELMVDGRPWTAEEPVVQAATYYRDFVRTGISPPAPRSWAEPPDLLFRTGQAPFVMGLFSDPLETPARSGPFAGDAAGPSGPAGFRASVSPVPRGPAGCATWVWSEGVAASQPASARALEAIGYLAEAIALAGWMPLSDPGREQATIAARVSAPCARSLPAHPALWEFDAAWMEKVVVPLLSQGEGAPDSTEDVRRLLHAAAGALQQALTTQASR